MFLLLTNQRDITTDFVVRELRRRGHEFFRLNTERLCNGKVSLSPGAQNAWTIEIGDRLLDGSSVEAAIFRRPGTPEISESIGDMGERTYSQIEWAALLRSIYMRLEGRWLNAPPKIAIAEDKPYQIQNAVRLGFDVPETLITNDIGEAVEFVRVHQPVIGKPLKEALLEGEKERAIFTSRLSALDVADEQSLAVAPVIFQREIPKRYDIRVTVVGTRVFATAIHSQEFVGTAVDWRRGSVPDLVHESIELPSTIADRCVKLVEHLGLRFGAIDLILGTDGRYWFLEINPNGQWAWIENRTGAPIASAIVDELEAIARS